MLEFQADGIAYAKVWGQEIALGVLVMGVFGVAC